MKKLTFHEFCGEMYRYNRENNITGQFGENSKIGYVVFTEDSFKKKYPLESRTYVVSSGNKYFIDGMGGNSIYASSLDGSDRCVRIDWYLGSWKVDYCYFKDDEN